MAKTKYERNAQLREERRKQQRPAYIQLESAVVLVAVTATQTSAPEAATARKPGSPIEVDSPRGEDAASAKEQREKTIATAIGTVTPCDGGGGVPGGCPTSDDEDLEDGEVRESTQQNEQKEGEKPTMEPPSDTPSESYVDCATTAEEPPLVLQLPGFDIERGDCVISSKATANESHCNGDECDSPGKNKKQRCASSDHEMEPVDPDAAAEPSDVSTEATGSVCSEPRVLPEADDDAAKVADDGRIHDLENELERTQRRIQMLETENVTWKQAAAQQQDHRAALLEARVALRTQALKLDRLVEILQNAGSSDRYPLGHITIALREIASEQNASTTSAPSSFPTKVSACSPLVFPARHGTSGRRPANGHRSWNEANDITEMDEYAIRVFQLCKEGPLTTGLPSQKSAPAVGEDNGSHAGGDGSLTPIRPVDGRLLLQNDDDSDASFSPPKPKRRRLRQRQSTPTRSHPRDPDAYASGPASRGSRSSIVAEDAFLAVFM